MPETTTKPRYASVPIEPDLFDAVGMDPADAGVPEIRSALTRYLTALNHARTTLGQVLGREELCLIADAMNGTWLIGEWMDHFRTMVIANIQDSEWPERRDGTRASANFADKWFGAGKGERATEKLLRKLRRLPPIQVDALALAVRDFWREPELGIDSDWWLPVGHPERKAVAEDG